MTNISRKALTFALINTTDVNELAAYIGADVADVQTAIDKTVAALNRPRKNKPSAETLHNREIAKELAEEINARGKEMTAAEVADVYTDPDGLTLNPRKVGALLRQAVAMGLIDVSPEPWSVKHYGPLGFEFAAKPVRKRKAKADDAPEDTEE